MTDYVRRTYPITNIDTKVLGNILLDHPDISRNYDVYSHYFYLVNGTYPTRSRNFTTKDTWLTKLIKWIRS